jgi:hypothetical protein
VTKDDLPQHVQDAMEGLEFGSANNKLFVSQDDNGDWHLGVNVGGTPYLFALLYEPQEDDDDNETYESTNTLRAPAYLH